MIDPTGKSDQNFTLAQNTMRRIMRRIILWISHASMWRIILWIAYAIVCVGAIVTYVTQFDEKLPQLILYNMGLSTLVMILLTQLAPVVDLLFRKKRLEVISAIYFGLLIGILLSYLLVLALGPVLDDLYRPLVVLLTTLILPYICISFLLQTRNDFRFVIPYVEFARELKGARPLILDSSALIDGRIADMVDTHVLDAQMLVPLFVLNEVQDIADSSDKMRRTRGRRGLEVLSKLQSSPNADVKMYEVDRSEFKGMSVDQRLVALAKQIGGRVVTNDFNLNKVASVQGIPVINLNDIANALKPRYLPGERLKIKILKEGESPGQGVGYLDDGTMVVCEQANHLVGKEIDVIVTSVLQSSAGRMIFGRMVYSPHREERDHES
ncbi:MAG: PIN/TRAM domain-containing protein [Acidimicrobiales bacterium]